MKLKVLLTAALAVVAGFAMVAAAGTVTAKEPGPSAGRLLASGLMDPRGIKLGPDGMLYVAEAGKGGDTKIVVEGQESTVGTSGRISRIDPDTGERKTVIDGLPSHNGPEGDSVGPADVAFVGDQLYYLQTHGGAVYGFPDMPTGIYRVKGQVTQLVADIGQFNIDNPVADVTNKVQMDVEPGGNPYSMVVRGGAFYVVDGNQNQVMKVTTGGQITRVAEIPGHLITTGITHRPAGGPFFVSTFGAFPFAPADGRVLEVGQSGGVTEIGRGVAMLTDIEFSPAGELYVLQFDEQAAAPGGPPFALFTGKVLMVNEDGSMTPLVTGFNFATSMAFDGDTLYVVNNGMSLLAPGEVWQIKNFSAIAPQAAPTAAPTQAPAPTATPRGGTIGGPDTGSGGYAGAQGDAHFGLVALALLAAAALSGAGVVAARKRG